MSSKRLATIAGLTVLAYLFATPFAFADRPPRVVVSTDKHGDAAYGSYAGSMTPDARFIVFASRATNLPRGDVTTDCPITYVHDLKTGSVEIVSQMTDKTVVCGEPGAASISNDGRFVIFQAMGEQGGPIFVRDRQQKTTTVASRGVDGAVLDIESASASLSGDGRFVAFIDRIGDSGEALFLRNLVAGRTRMLTVDANGDLLPVGTLGGPTISYNGRHIVVAASTVDSIETPPGWEWFVEVCYPGSCPLVYDRFARSFSTAGGNSGIDGWAVAAVSPHGRYVAWGGPSVNVSTLATDELVHTSDGLCCDGTMDVYWSGNERRLLAYTDLQEVARVNLNTGRFRTIAGTSREPCDAAGLTTCGDFALVTCARSEGQALVYLVGPIG